MTDVQDELYAIPKSWLWSKLNTVSEMITDGSHTPPPKQDSGIPMLSAQNILNGKITFSDMRYISSNDFEKEYKRAPIAPNDVLLTIVGTIGRSTVVRTNTPKFALQRSVALIKTRISPFYLSFFLQSPLLSSYLTKKARGTAQKGIYLNQLKDIPVAIAPLNEQRRIVIRLEELLARLDAGVEELLKVKAQLKRYRQAVLKYAFEGKLTEEWRKTHRGQMEPTTRMLGQKKHQKKVKTEGDSTENPPIDASTLPKLPESWVWIRLGDIAEKIVDGSHNPPPKQAMGIPMLSAQNILNNEIVFSKCRYVSENDYREETSRAPIEANDVLLTIVGTIGRSAVVKESMPKFTVQRSVAVIKSRFKAEYLSFLFQSPFYSSYFMKNAKGTAQKGIYLNQLEELPIVLAPIPEQNLIIGEIESQFSLVDKLHEAMELSSKQSERLRQSILTAAFNGRLVPQDPSDEPAEKLLERIKEETAKSKGKSDMNRRKNKPRQLELFTYVK